MVPVTHVFSLLDCSKMFAAFLCASSLDEVSFWDDSHSTETTECMITALYKFFQKFPQSSSSQHDFEHLFSYPKLHCHLAHWSPTSVSKIPCFALKVLTFCQLLEFLLILYAASKGPLFSRRLLRRAVMPVMPLLSQWTSTRLVLHFLPVRPNTLAVFSVIQSSRIWWSSNMRP